MLFEVFINGTILFRYSLVFSLPYVFHALSEEEHSPYFLSLSCILRLRSI